MSYITVPAEKVKTDAQAVIDRIMARRKERNEAAIAMQMTKFALQLKWPFITYFDRKSAIEYLSEKTWTFPSNYAWGDLDKAETLLIMAENGDPVNISNDDAKLLWG